MQLLFPIGTAELTLFPHRDTLWQSVVARECILHVP